MWKRGRPAYLCLALAVGACSGTEPESPSLAGVVIDSLAQVGIPGARVWAIPQIAFADANGAYQLALDHDGQYTVIVSSALHEPDTTHIDVSGAATLNVSLRRRAPFAKSWTGDLIPIVDLQGASTLRWIQAYYSYAAGGAFHVHSIMDSDLEPGPDSLTTIVRIDVPAETSGLTIVVRDRDNHVAIFDCQRDTAPCRESPP